MSVAERHLDALLAAARAEPDRLLVVVGPTASGKSALALAAAARLDGEIVSADSVQIVRGFDVGSGKPSVEERERVPHHLVDAIDPFDDIDASRFASLARTAIDDIRARGRVPIVCGGTFLWIRSLLYGLVEAPPADVAIRDVHRALVAREGRAALHQKLAHVDPASAARLHPNDVVRVGRALEVFQTTGQRLSDLQASHGFREARLSARLFAIARAPEELTRRIEARVAAMLAAGWIEEARTLMARGFAKSRPMGSVGYREVAAHVRGELPGELLEAAIVRATRVYARRQRTFLRQAEVTWLGAD